MCSLQGFEDRSLKTGAHRRVECMPTELGGVRFDVECSLRVHRTVGTQHSLHPDQTKQTTTIILFCHGPVRTEMYVK